MFQGLREIDEHNESICCCCTLPSPFQSSASFQLFLYWIKRGNFHHLITFNNSKLFSPINYRFSKWLPRWMNDYEMLSFPITILIRNRFLFSCEFHCWTLQRIFLRLWHRPEWKCCDAFNHNTHQQSISKLQKLFFTSRILHSSDY